MEGPDYIKFVIAFSVVIGMMFGLQWVLKKAGLATASRLPGAKRRLRVVEHLGIDSRHRLVLVQRDGVEHLLLLGHESDQVIETNIPALTPLTADKPEPIQQETAV